MEPSNRSDRKWWDRREVRRPANVRRDSIGHDFVTPGVLQVSDSSKGDVETPGEGHVSVGMATRNVNPAEEALRDLSCSRFVVWNEGNVGFDAVENDHR